MGKYQSKSAIRKSKLKIAERKLSGLCPECSLCNTHKKSCKIWRKAEWERLYGIAFPYVNIDA